MSSSGTLRTSTSTSLQPRSHQLSYHWTAHRWLRSHTCKHGLRGVSWAQPAHHLRSQPSQASYLCPHWRHPVRSRRQVVTRAAATGILPLGFDLLTFLGSTVVVVPLFKKLKISPILGFLLTGVVLHQFGLIRDPKDMEALSELGVLFLLFEMGLELSLDRLKALAKFAFGLGTLQMLACTAIFTAFALPAGQGLGTHLLESLAHAPMSLVSIRSFDEAVVIGGALSMSSSAFVLQLLTERGEMPTRYGSATLGILLLQDIAVVPFLVLLPLAVQLHSHGPAAAGDAVAAAAAAASNPASLVALLGPTALKTCAGLGLLLVGGRLLLRRVFEVVAKSDNSETFVALCLLTVAGAALLTEQLGFSDTLGAFVAGVLLSESSYKTQVEADIRPFRGLLLGLFFVSTGGSINMDVLRTNWQVIVWILSGLITIKTAVVTALGPLFGLSRSDSIRTGFMLSQGGEFAFVLLSLASSLHVLPENLNQVLIIVVVMSMALTPGLAQVGQIVGELADNMSRTRDGKGTALSSADIVEDIRRMSSHEVDSPVVICGFGPHAQILAALLDQPLASLPDPLTRSYIAFDLDPVRVQAAREAGFNAVYGDGSRAAVLKAAGVVKPRAIAVCLTTDKVAAHRAVASLRSCFPNVPLFALGTDIRDAAELEEAGADRCIMSSTTAGLSLGTTILAKLGASTTEVSQVARDLEEAAALRAHALSDQVARYGTSVLADESVLVIHTPVKAIRKSSRSVSSTDTCDALEGLDDGPSSAAVAPAESLPSMESAMPSYLAGRSGVPSNGATPPSLVAGTSAAEDPTHSYATTTADVVTSRGVRSVESANSRDSPETVEVPDSARQQELEGSNGNGHCNSSNTNNNSNIRNPIAGTAVACLDCGDDDAECSVEDVAGIVVVDAAKQLRVVEEKQRPVQRQSPTPVRATGTLVVVQQSGGQSSED